MIYKQSNLSVVSVVGLCQLPGHPSSTMYQVSIQHVETVNKTGWFTSL